MFRTCHEQPNAALHPPSALPPTRGDPAAAVLPLPAHQLCRSTVLPCAPFDEAAHARASMKSPKTIAIMSTCNRIKAGGQLVCTGGGRRIWPAAGFSTMWGFETGMVVEWVGQNAVQNESRT